MIKVPPSGPIPARIMVCGEAPGATEEKLLQPFVGQSGEELTKMLHEAGILRTETFITNVCKVRPPNNDIEAFIWTKKKDIPTGFVKCLGKWVHPAVQEGLAELEAEIIKVKPTVIIALGGTALWALTGNEGILKWRGSILAYNNLSVNCKIIPTIHPAMILRQWDFRAIAVRDLQRAKDEAEFPEIRIPKYSFTLRPSYQAVQTRLNQLLVAASRGPLYLSVDIETRAGFIACVGLAWNRLEAICLPLMCIERPEGYWSEVEEEHITRTLQNLLTHPNIKIIGQNFAYDSQYFAHHWGYLPNLSDDTMIQQHCAFPGIRKGLDFISSMYCKYYRYWKDEGKLWDPKLVPEDSLWNYNCLDAVNTFECFEVLSGVIRSLKRESVYNFQMRELHAPVLKIVLRGCRIDKAARGNLSMDLFESMAKIEQWFIDTLGQPLNPRSGKQMKELFYGDFKQKEILNYKTGNATLNDEALQKLAQREPLLRPLVEAISDYRTLGVYQSTFVEMPLDPDGRVRTSFNIAGPETFRFSSSENAFGRGGNLQNIPGADKSGGFLPNIRKLFIPDYGYVLIDADLEKADAQVVAWEADDKTLMQMFREGVDIHLENAKVIYNRDNIRKDSHERQMAKTFVHGCLTAGHEILTPKGWVNIEEYRDETPIMIWDKGKLIWEIPSYFHRDLATDLVSLEGESWSQEMTWDHRVLYATDSSGFRHVTQACKIPISARLPKAGLYGSTVNCPLFARQVAAYQADGTIDVSGALIFHVAKRRKVERLHELFPAAKFSEWSDGTFGCRVVGWQGAHLKQAGPWLLSWSAETLDAWLNELPYWDGHFGPTGRVEVMGTNKGHIEWVATVAHLRGKGASLNVKTNRPDNRKDLWFVGLNNRPSARVKSMTVSRRTVTLTPVFCPKTSSGFFLFRRSGKIGVTGNTNYGGQARTMAAHCGITVHESERAQRNWFAAHPGIKDWHTRISVQLQTTRTVSNKFGYKRFYFDRVDDSLVKHALAWVPQSTVACVINRGLVNIDRNLPEVQLLLQIHDSLVMQIPETRLDALLPQVHKNMLISIPYPEPLTIQVGLKIGKRNWGELESIKI